MADFIPPADADFGVWHDQFKTAATSIGTTLGITPADITTIGGDNTDFHAQVANSTTADATAKQATKDKNNSRRLAEQHARALARRIKAHPAYTPALGEQLGIEAAAAGGGAMSALSAEVAADKPVLKGQPLPNGAAEVKFTKGDSDGINLYSQRDGDAEMVFLARDTHSPYVDNRALLVAGKPEKRKYMARFLKNDQEYGSASDEMTVICSP